MSIYRRDTKFHPPWKDVFDKPAPAPFISKGRLTMRIPMSIFEDNRSRLVAELRAVAPHGLVMLEAAGTGPCRPRDPFFFWAFGYHLPAAIGLIDLHGGGSYLFMERHSEDYPRSAARDHLSVDGVLYLDQLRTFIESMISQNHCKEILILADQKQELADRICHYSVDDKKLYPAMANLMTHKSEMEIDVLSYVTNILESALIHIIKRFRPGMTSSQVEASFIFFTMYKSGFEQFSFEIYKGSVPIYLRSVSSRADAPKKEIVFESGDMCIIDVGAAYFGHSISLGLSLPVDDRFSDRQASVYDMVLQVHACICRELKSGAPTDLIRSMADRCLLKILTEDMRVTLGTAEGALGAGLGRLLAPLPPVRAPGPAAPQVHRLQLGGLYLVEAGCCLAAPVLAEAFASEALAPYVREELLQYAGISVQLSEPVIITHDGFRSLSSFSKSRETISGLRSSDPTSRTLSVTEVEKKNRTIFRNHLGSIH